jgi:4-coumarate--CoA ligase
MLTLRNLVPQILMLDTTQKEMTWNGGPAATANCMTADGYLKTGDIGHQDKNGYLYITDRLKELIKYKGFQVAPAELESLLVGHHKVADACVLGVYDLNFETELPRAYVAKVEGLEQTSDKELEKEIRMGLDGRVANHKRWRGEIRLVKEIPKSAVGKF